MSGYPFRITQVEVLMFYNFQVSSTSFPVPFPNAVDHPLAGVWHSVGPRDPAPPVQTVGVLAPLLLCGSGLIYLQLMDTALRLLILLSRVKPLTQIH